MKPFVRPSSSEANRLIALATSRPLGFSTLRASRSAFSLLIAGGKVVEWPHQKHGVHNAVCVIERASVAPSHACKSMTGLRLRSLSCLPHVLLYQIDEVDLMADPS